MVVDDFDFIRISPSTHKTDAPALVDPDTVLSASVTDKLLKTISRWNAQVTDDSCDVENFKLSSCVSLDLRR